MVTEINSSFLKLTRRAETSAREKLVQTFVDVGPLFSLLSGADHQILYGRRGTGKTHVLNYLANKRESQGDAVVFTDLRNIGSSAGIYADGTIAISERATRLLVDTLLAVHDSLYEYFVKNAENLDLSRTGPVLDKFAEAITQVKVVGGDIEKTNSYGVSRKNTNDNSCSAKLTKSPSLELSEREISTNDSSMASTVKQTGVEKLYVNFGTTSAALRDIVSCLGSKQLWVLLDEWSSIPIDLQPYLADLIRRALYSTQGVVVKIAAIEHRSSFMLHRDSGSYIGIEIGADASADVNLDDFMVFDNDSEKSQLFFQNLLSQHIAAALDSDPGKIPPKDGAALIKVAFSDKRAFEEYVRSAEGVPRDAINLISLAAQQAVDSAISMQHVRTAAKIWYQRDKEKVVSSNGYAHKLLIWIIDKVIGNRKARAFLLEANISDQVVEMLFDSRVLHILKRGVSSHDQPGVRYDVYKLDYGCYVDLLNTTKAPQGLLQWSDDENDTSEKFIDVPPDDYRSIRRAILKLDEFYKETREK